MLDSPWTESRHARGRWRDAARIVVDAVGRLLGAEPPLRPLVYASYLAALDTEEAAAADVARF